MEVAATVAGCVQGADVLTKSATLLLRGPIRRYERWLQDVPVVLQKVTEYHYDIPPKVLREFLELYGRYLQQRSALDKQLRQGFRVYQVPKIIKIWKAVNEYGSIGRQVSTKGNSISEVAMSQLTLCNEVHGRRTSSERCSRCVPDATMREREEFVRILRSINDAWKEIFTVDLAQSIAVDRSGDQAIDILADDSLTDPPTYRESEVSNAPEPWADDEPSAEQTQRLIAQWEAVMDNVDQRVGWEAASWSSRVRS